MGEKVDRRIAKSQKAILSAFLEMLLEIFVPDGPYPATIVMWDAGTESFGMYFRTLQSNEPLKIFIHLIKNRSE